MANVAVFCVSTVGIALILIMVCAVFTQIVGGDGVRLAGGVGGHPPGQGGEPSPRRSVQVEGRSRARGRTTWRTGGVLAQVLGHNPAARRWTYGASRSWAVLSAGDSPDLPYLDGCKAPRVRSIPATAMNGSLGPNTVNTYTKE